MKAVLRQDSTTASWSFEQERDCFSKTERGLLWAEKLEALSRKSRWQTSCLPKLPVFSASVKLGAGIAPAESSA